MGGKKGKGFVRVPPKKGEEKKKKNVLVIYLFPEMGRC